MKIDPRPSNPALSIKVFPKITFRRRARSRQNPQIEPRRGEGRDLPLCATGTTGNSNQRLLIRIALCFHCERSWFGHYRVLVCGR